MADHSGFTALGNIDMDNQYKVIGTTQVDTSLANSCASSATWETLKTITIPAAQVQADMAIKITLCGSITGTTNTKALRFSGTTYGSLIVPTVQSAGQNGDWRAEILLIQEDYTPTSPETFTVSSVWQFQDGAGTPFVDTFSDQGSIDDAWLVEGNRADGADGITLEKYIVEFIWGA